LPPNPLICLCFDADVIPPSSKLPPKINITSSTRNCKSNPPNHYSIRVLCLNIPNSYLHLCFWTVAASKPKTCAFAHPKSPGTRLPKLTWPPLTRNGNSNPLINNFIRISCPYILNSYLRSSFQSYARCKIKNLRICPPKIAWKTRSKINMTCSTYNHKSNPLDYAFICILYYNIPTPYLHSFFQTVIASKSKICMSAHPNLPGNHRQKLILLSQYTTTNPILVIIISFVSYALIYLLPTYTPPSKLCCLQNRKSTDLHTKSLLQKPSKTHYPSRTPQPLIQYITRNPSSLHWL
jgi:hypothetical protein